LSSAGLADWTVIASETTIAGMATAAASSLETTVYTSSSTHDALGRVLTAISPDGSEVAYAYNQRGALKTVDCKHRGSSTATPVVAEISYDVRGRRESITHAANSTTTTYAYDPLSFRLRAIETTRASDNKKLQGLHYHYDPVGNVTDIRDDAQQTVYFQNAIVEAANSYSYDALYRLVEATGREHATQGTAQRSSTQLPPDSNPVPMANDPNALRRYTQSYTYDAVGNLETVVHAPASGTGWTRRYQYRTDGNRLVGTSAPGDSAGPVYTNTATYSHTYPHDVHGNFTSMPHLAAMDWDELDQLQHCTAGSQEVYFQYAGGQRVRKYVEHAGATTEERIYLGGFELYRKRVNGTLKEEWESLHISDDTGRIVLVETHTVDDGNAVGSPTGIWRFQLSNHLGSAATEVTETGAVISYEEYHPYGTSAYRLVDNQIDVPAKRYRYTGMERDEETGLGYHTARYYAPWLGRWTAADPIGVVADIARYAYAANNPVQFSDLGGLAPGDGTEKFRGPPVQVEVESSGADMDGDEETLLLLGTVTIDGPMTRGDVFVEGLVAFVKPDGAAVGLGRVRAEAIAEEIVASSAFIGGELDDVLPAGEYPIYLGEKIYSGEVERLYNQVDNVYRRELDFAIDATETVAEIIIEEIPGVGDAYSFGVAGMEFIENPSWATGAGIGLAAAGIIPGVGALKHAKKLDTATDAARQGRHVTAPATPPAPGTQSAGGPRFVAGERAGQVVDVQATPAGRYIQPDRSATDILQVAAHPHPDPFVSRTHTHPVTVARHPTDPTRGSTRLGEPREVTFEEVINIRQGFATRGRPRGR
jgi:RHS repeat-associated protein